MNSILSVKLGTLILLDVSYTLLLFMSNLYVGGNVISPSASARKRPHVL